MKKFLASLLLSLCVAASAYAQTPVAWPDVVTTAGPKDFGNGPLKIRVLSGVAYIFTSQGSGLGSTAGSSTTLTLTATPPTATKPIVGAKIAGSGITVGTTITAYDGTTGVTLSAAMNVSASTSLTWGAACPATVGSAPFVSASAGTEYYTAYTASRICGVSPGAPSEYVATVPYPETGSSGGGTSSTFGVAFPLTGTAAGMSVGGNMTALTGTGVNLNVQCANCTGSGASAVDEAAFTAGASVFAPGGGFFQTTATNNPLTNGQQGMQQFTAQRAGFVNLRNANGVEIGTSTTPVQVSVANTAANGTAIKVDGSAVTQPVSGTVGATQSTSPWVVSGTVTAANASVGATGATVPSSATFPGLSDGTNLNGWLSAKAALNSTGAGIGTAQGVGQFDDVAPTAITENQFGNLRISANRNLYGTIRDAAGNERGANVSAGNALIVDGSAATQPVSAASLPLPALASTSTKQSDGSQKTQIVDGSGNVIASTSNNLNVQCANCSGSGVSTADQATFTAGSSLFAGSGGFFQTTATSNALTTGQQGMFQLTANRALFSNLRNAAGTEVGTSTTPLQVSLGNTGANTNKLLVTPDSVALPANQSVDVSRINAVTPLMGNGVTGTGSQRVTIASDNTAFSVNATLAAETTKVVGTVRVLGNAGAIFDAATGAAAPPNGLYVGLSDGTNLNGWLSAKNALNSTGAGVGTAQIVGQCDDTTPAALTENQFGNGRIDCTDHTLATGGLVTTNAPTYSTATARGLSLTTAGGLRADLKDSASNTNAFLVNGGTTPADGAALGTTSIRAYSAGGVYNGSTIDLAREAVNSTNSTGTGITAVAAIGQCDDVSPTALTENQFGNARIDCATHAVLTTPTPSATAGGTTLFTLTLAASTNATNVKASAGQLYSISGFNMSSATPIWISLYNNSGTPTCGTSVIQQFMIPGNTTGAGFVHDFAMPKGFSSGIAFCATTGIAGTGNAAASTYVLNIDYK